ncbi:hypothetical protein AK812_SmicGene41443, partial [Symbiodinium microadriaticum]
MACPSFWLNLQVGPKESSWDQFRMSGISFDSAAGLGGQLRFLKETPTKSTKGSARPLAGLDEWQLAAKVQELVQLKLKVQELRRGTGLSSLVPTLISCPTAADLTELISK